MKNVWLLPVLVLGPLFYSLLADDPRVKSVPVVPRSAVEDAAYNATTWNGNTNVATKNAIRDKFESLAGGAVNPTSGSIPYNNAGSFGDSPLFYNNGVSGDGMIALEPDYSIATPPRRTAFWLEPYGGSNVNAPLALYVENDVSTLTNSSWPAHIGRVGNIGGYFLSVPDKTNTTAVALFGAVDPAQYYYSIGVLGVIEEQSGNYNATNVAVAASVNMSSGAVNAKSAAIYATVEDSIHDPVIEKAVVLIDNNDSGFPLLIARTANGTKLFKIDATGSISVWDGSTLQPVTFGAADSGGVGYRALRIPN